MSGERAAVAPDVRSDANAGGDVPPDADAGVALRQDANVAAEPLRDPHAADGALAEAIALRVAELVAPRPPARLLTVDQVAEMLQVRPEWVYEHADELGAFRLGGGARGRLRFDAQQVRERLRAPAASASPRRSRPRPRRSTAAAAATARAETPLLRVGPKR